MKSPCPPAAGWSLLWKRWVGIKSFFMTGTTSVFSVSPSLYQTIKKGIAALHIGAAWDY